MEEIALFKRVLKETEEGILVIDGEEKNLYANASFKKIFSISMEITGKKVREIISHQSFLEAIEEAKASEDITTREITLNGTKERELKLRCIPFDGGFICFFQDITEERRLERTKRDFVSNVSHEMRTPLANIRGYTETLLDGALEERQNLRKFL